MRKISRSTVWSVVGAWLAGSSWAEQCHLRAPNGREVVVPSKPISSSAGASASATATGTATGTATSPTVSETPFKYGTDTIRGVNLGGWFVLEPWITPSMFENTGNDDIVDEFTFGQLQDDDVALKALQNHWETWMTEEDFANMSAAGLNHVRLPVGYWSVPLTSSDTNFTTSVSPYTPGAWPYILQALNWAKAHNIHVILDLHGAPGSQNGYDNSGQRTSNPQWANASTTNVARTLDILRFMVKNVGGMVDVIELLNEAAGFTSSQFAETVRQFWQDGYDVVREAAGGGIKVMIGDAFLGVDSWEGFLTYPSAEGVIMDNHEYQIFSVEELSRSEDEHIAFACNTTLPTLKVFAASNIYTIIGEWSNAPTDCAKWLNGRGVGARWDGTWFDANTPLGNCTGWTGDMSTFSDDYKTFLRKYWEAQVAIGEAIQGWIFWTWKAENADEWSYQKGLEGGWIPQDPTDRLYPDICG
ncbi:glycoside hydrolase family 5 protein [Punctularia strigosozonata HHB-11173 SS5]|uniref:Glycoside hydrolase family 5 protein n=1 Tax=Punctularia strigosozonata (strain HHB-11173) TaxID=741275 RepID=R7S3P9_PUNST|nr:glycoside hydrolase family 5 protein [Punctularia strigosozonata HHB-11173 SS5]EIN04828.1 glycoside hydrolase family 5 protein [Punctularia strigosozonata HHB-11173 SS5]